jgi:excisionase family DNA binding protein
MNDEYSRPDTGHMDTSTHDQTSDMSMDNAVSIRHAAAIAHVTEKTIRRWIKSGRLPAVKLGGQYRITIAALESARTDVLEGDVQNIDVVSTHHPDSGQDFPRVNMSEGVDTVHGEGRQADAVDLAPLTALIDDLTRRHAEQIDDFTRRNADLAAAAAMWQTRAAHLENELKQLTAGETQPQAEPEPATVSPGSPESDRTEPSGIRAWWKRLWGS